MEESRTKNMATNIIIKVILLIVIVLTTIYIVSNTRKEFEKTTLDLNGTTYQIEIATTSNQKAKGLSKRDNLCPNCGMLFIFNKDKNLPFWMKNTLIPLDLIWINSQKQIVDIQTAQPETNKAIYQLTTYQNKNPAKYVLELNANDSKKLKFKIGDTINLPNF